MFREGGGPDQVLANRDLVPHRIWDPMPAWDGNLGSPKRETSKNKMKNVQFRDPTPPGPGRASSLAKALLYNGMVHRGYGNCYIGLPQLGMPWNNCYNGLLLELRQL